MNKKEIIKILDKEIKWHEENMFKHKILSTGYKKGFIKGIKQAKFIIENIDKEM